MLPITLLELKPRERDLVRAFRLLDDHQKSVIHRFSMSEAGVNENWPLDDLEIDSAMIEAAREKRSKEAQ